MRVLQSPVQRQFLPQKTKAQPVLRFSAKKQEPPKELKPSLFQKLRENSLLRSFVWTFVWIIGSDYLNPSDWGGFTGEHEYAVKVDTKTRKTELILPGQIYTSFGIGEKVKSLVLSDCDEVSPCAKKAIEFYFSSMNTKEGQPIELDLAINQTLYASDLETLAKVETDLADRPLGELSHEPLDEILLHSETFNSLDTMIRNYVAQQPLDFFVAENRSRIQYDLQMVLNNLAADANLNSLPFEVNGIEVKLGGETESPYTEILSQS